MRLFVMIVTNGFLIGLVSGSAFGQIARPLATQELGDRRTRQVGSAIERPETLSPAKIPIAVRSESTLWGATNELGHKAVTRWQSPDPGWLESAWKITAAQPKTGDGQTLLLTEQRTDDYEELYFDEGEELYFDEGEVIAEGDLACACPPGDVCTVCCPPPFAHGTGGYGEWLYLHPSDVDFTFAIPSDGTAPIGAVGIVDPGYESAFRAGFVVALDSCSSVAASYTLFEHNVMGELSVDTSNEIISQVIHPVTASASSMTLLTQADYDIDFEMIDVDFRSVIMASPRTAINYLAGIRYGHLEQEAEVRHALVASTTTVNTVIDFEGIGVRLGLDGERRICRGLIIYGRGIFNLMAGDFDATYRQFNTSNLGEADTAIENDRIVPILEYELGFGWVSRRGRIRVSAGYNYAAWFNTLTTPTWIQAVRTANFIDVDETLTFNGFTSRAEVRW